MRAAARNEVAHLETLITPHADRVAARAFESGLAAALQSPCMWRARENPRPLAFESGPQAATWWSSGGKTWLESLTREPAEREVIVLPPDVLPILTGAPVDLDASTGLLCVDQPDACGAEPAAWRLRATESWAQQGPGPAVTACSDALGTAPAYRAWRSCVEVQRVLGPAFPIGTLRAPTRGWFRVRTHVRREREVCEELRVYGLERGDVAIARTCRGPAGTRGAPLVTHGTIPVSMVREALWMTLLAPEVLPAAQASAQRVALPNALARSPSSPIEQVPVIAPARLAVGGAEAIEWAWVEPDRVLAQGITWPDSIRPGDLHALHLWRVADAGLTTTCPGVAPPAGLPLGEDDALVRALRLEVRECSPP